VLVDVGARQLEGGAVEKRLESVGIIANRNVIPGDENRPGTVSGVRFGTAAVTTRGMGTAEMDAIASLIDRTLMAGQDQDALDKIKKQVAALCQPFPIYTN